MTNELPTIPLPEGQRWTRDGRCIAITDDTCEVLLGLVPETKEDYEVMRNLCRAYEELNHGEA